MPQTTKRCRLFGHRWGLYIDGEFCDAPPGGPFSGMTSGVTSFLRCKRCETRPGFGPEVREKLKEIIYGN